MSREYPFELPYHVGFFSVGVVIWRLQQAGVWEELKDDARSRLENCGLEGVLIERKDLDCLSDETYGKLLTITV